MKLLFKSFFVLFVLITNNVKSQQFFVNANITFPSVTSYDVDAQPLIDAIPSLSTTEKNAYNTLVVSMKSNGLWTKTIAFYPMLGGTAASQKWNAKDVRDLDAAFRITWSGTLTHSSTGVIGNGTTGFGNTHFIASTTVASGLYAIGAYCRTNVDGEYEVLGANSNFNGQISRIQPRAFNTFYGQISNSGQTVGNADARGWYFASRTASNTSFLQKNETQTTATVGAVGVPSVKMYISARNSSGTTDRFAANEIASAGVWTALSTAEGVTLYNIILVYMTALGRNI